MLKTWEAETNQPENAATLSQIREWWESLDGKKVTWRQRLISPGETAQQLQWETQKFDETFTMASPQLRGITLYWRKPEEEQEHSTTPRKLEWALERQQLYIYPRSRQDLVLRVGLQEIIYQTIHLENPQVAGITKEGNCLLLLRDPEKQLEIKVTLDQANHEKLKQVVSPNTNL
jgi:hypothetical protein